MFRLHPVTLYSNLLKNQYAHLGLFLRCFLPVEPVELPPVLYRQFFYRFREVSFI